MTTPTFAGELQLAGWSESHNSGCKVTFWLQSSEELEAFRALTVRKGNTAGHRFMAALVEIGDDEKPVEPPEKTAKQPREPMGDACYRTVMWCQDPEFWKFLESHYPDAIINNAIHAAEYVKTVCDVVSRKELDTEPEANRLWHEKIRGPYSKWLIARGVVR